MIDRFKALLKEYKLSPSEFADKIGIQRSSLSHVLSGRNKPSVDFLEKIIKAFPDIDVKWLITGLRSEKSFDGQQKLNLDKNAVEKTKQSPEITGSLSKAEAPGELGIEQIIIVYSNGTFRMLKSSDDQS